MRTKQEAHRNRVLAMIAVFKFFKAGLMIAAGVGALELLQPDFVKRTGDVIGAIASPLVRHRLEHLLGGVTGMRPSYLRALGIGAFIYAGVFLVEGTGLWLEQRWAEFLTVIVTALLIPIEAYELSRRVTLPRLAALVLNVAIVIYLIQQLRRKP